MRFHKAQLPNGLTVLGEHNPSAHTFAAGIFVKTGSRDEPGELNGVSHFLEHMMFKGSARLSATDMNRIFDEMGASYNAFTTQEMTAYYGCVLPKFTERMMVHLGELFDPAIRDGDFDMEKNVILEEIAMYGDEPGQRVYERLMAAHFDPHPLGMSVIGTPGVIKAMTRDGMADYFKAHYAPSNMVLSVAGRFAFDEIVGMAQRLYGHWKGPLATRRYPAATPDGRRVAMSDPKLNRAYVMGMTPGPSAQDPDRFAAKVLSDIVGEAEGSRFYWALVDNALCEDADFGFYPHDRSGSFYLSLQTDPDRVEEVLAIAIKELKRVRDDLTEDEVLRARNKLASNVTIGAEAPLARMRAVGTEWLYNQTYRSVEEDLATLESLDRDAVRRLLDKYTFDPMTIVSLGPKE